MAETIKEEIKEGEEKTFNIADLSTKKQNDFRFVQERITTLQTTRQNHYGHNLDKLWQEADRDYIPHRLKSKGKKVQVTDEDKGWRSAMTELGGSNWQSDLSQANPYIKIQTALSILVDQNPSADLTPLTKKYEKTNEIVRQLYRRSWEYAKSKDQLKLFVFNLAKYGWACARTYPLRITRKVKVVKEYDTENPEESEYETKDVIEYNDIMRENLDPRNVWIDDMAKPSNPWSLNDWCWRKVYDIDTFKKEFGGYKLIDLVKAGGNTQEVTSQSARGAESNKPSQKKVEVFFYENKAKDLFCVIANGTPVIMEPLPVSDTKGLKKLSLWQAYWTLRHAESPYGVGIYEAIRYDQSALDRIRNMTIDQLTLSIYKMFFFQGTQSLTETGDIKIAPGVGKQVLDPKNMQWLDVPGPGQEAFLGIDMFRKDVDEVSGITDPLLGAVTGKTAFEIAQAKESALKRLKNPLDNILEALEQDGYITISLMQILYSIPETYQLVDEELINSYLREVGSDPELFERSEGQEGITAKVYPEFPLNLDDDGAGNLIEAADTRFFRVKPGALEWDGFIHIRGQSLLSPSKQVDKALDLEMWNMLLPLMQGIAQERQMLVMSGQQPTLDNLTHGKAAKAIIKLYDKDPRDVFPDDWLTDAPPQANPAQLAMQQLFTEDPNQMQRGAAKMVPSTQAPTNPQSIAGQVSAQQSQPFRAV